MITLLIIAPSGKQELIRIDETGSYFDPTSVLWDERVDGSLPAGIALGKMQRSGNELVALSDYLPEHAAEILAEKRTEKTTELRSAAAAAVYADITHAGQAWRTDKESRDLLADVLSAGSVPPEMYWRDASGTPHAMTYADLQALARAILDRGLGIDSNLITKTAAVAAATTAAEIDAIAW